MACFLCRGGDMAAGDVGEECAEGGRWRWWQPPLALRLRGCGASRQQADSGALHITLAARDLPRKPQPGLGAQSQLCVEELGAVEEGVAVEAAQPCELGPLQ